MAMKPLIVHSTSPSVEQFLLMSTELAMRPVHVRPAPMEMETNSDTIWESLTLSSHNFMRVSVTGSLQLASNNYYTVVLCIRGEMIMHAGQKWHNGSSRQLLSCINQLLAIAKNYNDNALLVTKIIYLFNGH